MFLFKGTARANQLRCYATGILLQNILSESQSKSTKEYEITFHHFYSIVRKHVA
jgi:hypothetical protein